MQIALLLAYPFADLSLKKKIDCITNSNITVTGMFMQLFVSHLCPFDHGVQLTIITSIERQTVVVNDFSLRKTQFLLDMSIPPGYGFIQIVLEDVGLYAMSAVSRVIYDNALWDDCLDFTGVTMIRDICFVYRSCTPVTVQLFHLDIYIGATLLLSLENAGADGCFPLNAELVDVLGRSPLTYRFTITAYPAGNPNMILMRKSLRLSEITAAKLGIPIFVSYENTTVVMLSLSYYTLQAFSGLVPTLKILVNDGTSVFELGAVDSTISEHLTVFFPHALPTGQYQLEILAFKDFEVVTQLSQATTLHKNCWNASVSIYNDREQVNFTGINRGTKCQALSSVNKLSIYGPDGRHLGTSDVQPGSKTSTLPQLSHGRYNDQRWILIQLWASSQLLEAIVVTEFTIVYYKKYAVIAGSTLTAIVFVACAGAVTYYCRLGRKMHYF